MPATAYTCPKCRVVLKTANPIPAGKAVKCPKCANVFAPGGSGLKAAAPGGGSGLKKSAQGITPTRPSAQGVTPTRSSAQGVQKSKSSSGGGLLKGGLVVGCLLFFVMGVVGAGAIAWWQFGDTLMAQAGLRSSESKDSNDTGKEGTPKTSAKDKTTPPTQPTTDPPVSTSAGDPLAYLPKDSNLVFGVDVGSVLSQ